MIVILAFTAFVKPAATGYVSEELVFPKVIQERIASSEKVVFIKPGIFLNLEKSHILADQLILTDSEDDALVHTIINGTKAEENLYHDKYKGSSLFLHQTGDAVYLKGMLTPEWQIEPSITEERSPNNGVAHRVAKIPKAPLYCKQIAAEANHIHHNVVTESRQLPELVTPEVYVISDYRHNQAFTHSDLVAYMAALFNAVNLRFASISKPSVRLRLVGIQRGTPETEIYMKKHLGHTLGTESLLRLRNYVNYGYVHGNPDMVYLMTGKKIATLKNGRMSTRVSGLAYVGGLCWSTKVAIGEDIPLSYKGVHIAAHEIAHLLGAVHDGSGPISYIPGHPGAKKCPWSDGYIMSYIDSGEKNFRFSVCTNEQIRILLRNRDERCIGLSSEQDLTSKSSKLPGQTISGSTFCEARYPSWEDVKYRVLPGMEKKCLFHCCGPTDENGAAVCQQHPALDGMSCEKEKICKNGICT
ncbi:venom metalloproteinase antarease-like TtrivMP_A [Ixodes scapularis]|uniref:venom metalloproteinase antarease-like TtrivMP_A n=1 Tax=Ixodes scapularis TaxID=6945 RepID=UPI001C385865|nr:venom metalloproteinase antarease-like TtrivMP_A [Ixodes scapularis]